MFTFTTRLPRDPPTQPQPPPARGQHPCRWQGEGLVFFRQSRPSRRSLRGSSVHRMTVVVRVVAPAPFEAALDAPACASKLVTHQPRSSSLPRDNIDQCCEVRLAANSTSIRLSPDSAAWFRGAEGRQVLAYPPCITDEASEVLDALVRAQHHPDSMRPRRHCGARRLSAHLNDVDRTMRSRLRNPRTRRHPLSARIT